MQIRRNEKTMRIICIQINESEQMRSFFFFFSSFALHKTIIPPWYNQRRPCRCLLPALRQTFGGEKSRNWLVGVSAFDRRVAAKWRRCCRGSWLCQFEHVGDAIITIKIKWSPSVTQPDLWNNQWRSEKKKKRLNWTPKFFRCKGGGGFWQGLHPDWPTCSDGNLPGLWSSSTDG